MQKPVDFSRLNHPLASKIKTGAKEYLYFGGTAYLGIPQNEDFLALYLEGIKKYGLSNGTSRNNNVQIGIYSEVEAYAAQKYGAEEGLVTSSGFLAAQIAVQTLSKLGEVIYAPATHPALWTDGAPKVVDDFRSWSKLTVEKINGSIQNKWVIISNAMNNLYPEVYDFSFLEDIDPIKQVIAILDDSHGIGINNDGLSVLSAVPKTDNIQTIVVASMAKALGVDAGLIIGPASLVENLKETNAFLGASPPAAAGLYAYMKAETIYKSEFDKLRQNMFEMEKALAQNGDWHFIRNFPVYFYKNTDLSERLLKQQILLSAFPYPDKNGDRINRVVLSSRHDKADIKHLIDSLN